MLPPASREGLTREVALDVLAQLEELHASHRRCPHCGLELEPAKERPRPAD